MQPPYDVLNLYHVIRLNWSSFLNRIVRAPARARARFFCFLYCLFPRSHYCARPMRFGLKASTEKAWKDTGKASKTQIHMGRQVRSAWIRNDAGRYEFYFTCISYQSAGFQKFFFLACTDVRREMCAECTTATKFFAPAFWGPGQYKDLLQNRKLRMLCIQCGHKNKRWVVTWVGISVNRARSGFFVKHRKTTEDFAQCEPWHK